MKFRKLKLNELRVSSFITATSEMQVLKGGLKCPLYTHDDLICELNTLDPGGVTCGSTGNTDNPTGGLSGTL